MPLTTSEFKFMLSAPWESSREALFKSIERKQERPFLSVDIDDIPDLTCDLEDEDYYYNKILSDPFDFIPYANEEHALYESTSNKILFHQLKQKIISLIKNPTNKNYKNFYEQVIEKKTPGFYFDFLELILTWDDDDMHSLMEIALWLALNSPDRNAVIFGLIFLGLLPNYEDEYIFNVFQNNELFIPYCALRALTQYDLNNNSRNEFKTEIIKLYRKSAGCARYFILQMLENMESDASDIIDNLLPFGPPVQYVRDEASDFFVTT